jgi:penicillin amidase/acyl-homoserine-lactone acylase
LDDEWREFDVTEAPIKVKLWGPFAFTSKQAVKHSVHGPVIESTHGTYALRYAGMDEIRQLEQVYRLGRAKNLDQFMGAMSLNAMPSNNYVYADKDGNVAFIHNGQYPARLEGWDWSKDLPGDRSDLIWSGYRPYSEAPMLINPESGLVFNANNQPFVATDGTDNLQPSDFPISMGLQTNMTNRAMRLVELTDSGDIQPISRQRLLDIKFDLSYSKGSKAAKVVESVLSEDWSADERLKAAAETLRAWNFSTHKDNRQAALGVLTSLPKTTEKYTPVKAKNNKTIKSP